MKKRVAVIISGQMRMNSLSPTQNDSKILDSWSKYLFNEEFSSKYDYDVFISTDGIELKKAGRFFGRNLINVACWETNSHLMGITRPPTLPHETLYKRFLSLNFGGFNPYPEQYHQYYRALLAYEMVIDYQDMTNTKYDYFIKIRPDLKFQKSLMPIFEELDGGKKAFMEHNLFEVASFEFFELLFRLAYHYGLYHHPQGDGANAHGEYPNFCPMDCSAIRFSSEMQVTNCLYEIMAEKGYDPSKYFFGSIYNGPTGSNHTYCFLQR